MKLSTKGRYGVKAMLDLAIRCSEGHVSLKSIAENQGISENYLEQLFAILRKDQLVKSIRGAQGGYILGQDADKITVGMILRSLEGSLAPVDCVHENEPYSCNRAENCVTKKIWEKVRDRINGVVDSITLDDLIKDYNDINKNDYYSYFI